MEAFMGIFGLLGVLTTVGIPVIMVVLFVMLVTSTKKQESLLTEILSELKRKDTNKDNYDN
ncbi:MAG TPA: hypothetical protein DCR24_10270 [Bacillus bacterium]|nr:hypothetical protein [Bacillus sp. (in: firmicutes)]